ncbi:MAG: hypothetical protein M1824_002085 [Vezdaea acicularis]|nr:MAG: hypothetical protein M1824_002085 [Vezdaea acicularis]
MSFMSLFTGRQKKKQYTLNPPIPYTPSPNPPPYSVVSNQQNYSSYNVPQSIPAQLPPPHLEQSPYNYGYPAISNTALIAPQHTQYQFHPAASQPNLALLAPPSKSCPLGLQNGWTSLTNLSTAMVAPVHAFDDGIREWQHKTTGYLNQGASLCDILHGKLNDIITAIDAEVFSGDRKDLSKWAPQLLRYRKGLIETVVIYQPPPPQPALRGGSRPLAAPTGKPQKSTSSGKANCAISDAITSTNYFAKANLYSNSRLPPNLPPLRLYMPSYPLLCLAAQYSTRVYTKPKSAERSFHISADWRQGTKAMVIKSLPLDSQNTIVFAIRGSQTFMDWAVNLNSTPASPTNFLDDPGNFCHSGFLSVARKMLKPVASRLRQLLEENPDRRGCSLLITGHSAGGAVAALLYAHMLSNLDSELTALTGAFKRVHCITFGAPPVSLLPLQKPDKRRYRKFLFLGLINEGDPVPRADKTYVRSLLDLYASPTPHGVPTPSPPPRTRDRKRSSPPKASPSKALALRPGNNAPDWPVPPNSLSNAGHLVLLRAREDGREVRACTTSDEQLRSVIFGDPVMHMMKVYARRVEVLATEAVTGRAW